MFKNLWCQNIFYCCCLCNKEQYILLELFDYSKIKRVNIQICQMILTVKIFKYAYLFTTKNQYFLS